MKNNIVFLFLLAMSYSAFAGAYYVSIDGSDEDNDGSYESPWRTIAFATCGGSYKCPCTTQNDKKIGAGDTLFIRGGVYTEHAIDLTNSGSVDKPILIRNTPGENVTIDGEYKKQIFYLGTTYKLSNIIIKGLHITRGLVAGVYTGVNYTTENITIDSCTITDIKIADNTACVYMAPASDSITVRNSYLNLGHPDTSRGAGIEIFLGGNNHVIENNDITGTLKGIYYKHGVNGGTAHTLIRNNYIHDIHNDFSTAGIAINTDNVIIKNNLIVNCQNPIKIYDGEPTTCDHVGGFNAVIDHNTIINSEIPTRSGSIFLKEPTLCKERGARHTTISNNLVVGNDILLNIWHYGDADAIGHDTRFENNLFFSYGTDKVIEYRINYTFTAFAEAKNLQNGLAYDEPVLNQDYSLDENSPGYKGGPDGIDIGADIKKVGTNYIDTSNVNLPIDPKEETPTEKENGCGCGAGAGLAFLPPLFFKFKKKIL